MTTPSEIHAAAERLRVAWPNWAAVSVRDRTDVLLNWREALCAYRQPIINALIADTGRTRISESEFDGVLRRIDYWAEHAPKLLEATSSGQSATALSVRYEHRLHPLGVVGIISPWNVPLLLSVIDALPALFAGCAVILKPSEVTPRFAEPLQASVQAVDELARVFEITQGDGAVGEAMVDVADAVCFTGSTGTGRKVAMRAAARLIPTFLELGGKDPLIVLADADMGRAVTAALRGSVLNTGQACDSNYGLSAAVIGDETHALSIASQIHAGAVSINDTGLTTMVSDVEKDSFNESGLGASRMGDRGLLRFVRKQSLLVQTGEALPIDVFREEVR